MGVHVGQEFVIGGIRRQQRVPYTAQPVCGRLAQNPCRKLILPALPDALSVIYIHGNDYDIHKPDAAHLTWWSAVVFSSWLVLRI
jgi:hypothetical protein